MFIISVILSSLAINLFILKGHTYLCTDLFTSDLVYGNGEGTNDILTYIAFKRLKQIFIIFILFRTFRPKLILEIIAVCFGIFWGMIITNQIYICGFTGIIILLLCFLPHYPVYILLIKNIYNFNICSPPSRHLYRYILLFICIFSIGVVCESFFSRFFLKQFYQYVVMR